MRLYIMIGLPTETDEDIEAIVGLAERTQAHMAEVGCKGRLTLSINPFIPKPFTPFQWMAMDNQKTVEKKLQYIKKGTAKESPYRGSRRVTKRGVYSRCSRSWRPPFRRCHCGMRSRSW